MKTLTLIATRDFHTSAGKHVAGQTIATIHTTMTSGELSMLLRGDDRVSIECDEDGDDSSSTTANTPDGGNDPDGEAAAHATIEANADFDDVIDKLQASGDEATQQADAIAQELSGDQAENSSQGESDGTDNRLLSDLIESRPAKLFAALDPPVTTVAGLAAWLADGNQPRQISGIAETTEGDVLEATGLSLPA